MRLLLPAASFLLVLAPLTAAQSTWYVDVNGSAPGSGSVADPYTSIDFALAQPSTLSGDLVLVLPGTYAENVRFPAKGVHVTSTGGPAVTTIDAGGSGSAVSFLGTDGTIMVLDGFTVTGGSGTNTGFVDGGGIYGLDARISLFDCVVKQNDAERGGGLFVENCITEALHCTFRENNTMGGYFVTGGGGLYLLGGKTWLLGSSAHFNTAGTPNSPGRGGGVYSAGALIMRRTVLQDNVAEAGGGGLYGMGRLEKCRLARNLGQFGGGAQAAGGTLEIYDSFVNDNKADSTSGTANFGGGVYGMAQLVRTTVQGNRAFGDGGGLGGGVTLTDCSVLDNQAFGGFGGAGLVAGGASFCQLLRCTLARNTATGDGGSYIAHGGGAANSTLDECAVYENAALGPNATGGGLAACDADFTTVYDNDCDGKGGGAADTDLGRCTIVGNTAGVAADGVYFGNATFVSIVDSIVWANGEEVLFHPGAIGVVAYSDVQGGYAGTGNIDADPDFWNEAARDLHLKSTSPCIDAGNPLSPPDPDGSRADMGAYPYDPTYTGADDGR